MLKQTNKLTNKGLWKIIILSEILDRNYCLACFFVCFMFLFCEQKIFKKTILIIVSQIELLLEYIV